MTYYPDPIPINTLFSSWVFLWAITYCIVRRFSQINTKWFDPTFAILFALSYQFFLFVCILFSVTQVSKLLKVLIKFAIISIVFKLLPLYFVWVHQVDWTKSIISCAILFSVYIAYISYLGIDLFDIYNDLTESFIQDDDRIQFERFLCIFYK
jgi:hypothetical protein